MESPRSPGPGPEAPAPLDGLLVIVRSPAAQVERRATIDKTWRRGLEALGARFLWSIHYAAPNGQMVTTFRSAESDLANHLWIPGVDSHGGLTGRMIETFRWLAQGIGKDLPWTHTLHMDDDCTVLPERLASEPWRNSDVYGHKNDGWYFAGGPGVILSREAIRVLDYYLCRDDCAIGALLSVVGASQGLKMTHTPNFRPWREVGWPTRENGTAIQHYVRDPDEISHLYTESREWITTSPVS